MMTLDQKKVSSSAVKKVEPKSWIIRSYREGDEHEILDLWRLVFQQERSLDHWVWKFKRNRVHVALACTALEQKIVGHYPTIPIKINFMGEPVLACVIVDVAIHPDFRRQNMFVKTAQYCFEESKKNGTCVILGFPGPTSYPGHVRRLGLKPITHLKQYWLRLRIYPGAGGASKIVNGCYSLLLRSRLFLGRLLLSRLPNNMTFRLTNNLTFCESKVVPDGYDEFWNAIRSYEVLSLWKDSEYLQWRYDQNPDHDFNYFYLAKDDEIVALAIVTADFGGYLTICELLVKDRNVLDGRLLINRILSNYSRGEQKKVRFIGSDIGFFDEVFANFRSEIWFGVVLCGDVFDNPALEEYFVHPSNWTLTFGDMDLV